MDEPKIFQTIKRLEQEIADLKKAKLNDRFLNFFKRSFTKLHVVIGIVIVIAASSFILYATQILFTDETVISASEVNSNFTELYNKTSNISARVYNSSAISIPSGTEVKLTFNSESFDNGNLHDTTSNTSRLTAPTDGIYLINAQAYYASATNQFLYVWVNGSTLIASVAAPYVLNINTIYKLSANDYVEVSTLQSTGSTINVIRTPDYTPIFSMVRLASD